MDEEEVPALVHREQETAIRRDGQATDGVGVLIGEGEAGVGYQVEGRHAIPDQAVEGVAIGGEDHVAPRVDRAREAGETVPEAHAWLGGGGGERWWRGGGGGGAAMCSSRIRWRVWMERGGCRFPVVVWRGEGGGVT